MALAAAVDEDEIRSSPSDRYRALASEKLELERRLETLEAREDRSFGRDWKLWDGHRLDADGDEKAALHAMMLDGRQDASRGPFMRIDSALSWEEEGMLTGRRRLVRSMPSAVFNPAFESTVLGRSNSTGGVSICSSCYGSCGLGGVPPSPRCVAMSPRCVAMPPLQKPTRMYPMGMDLLGRKNAAVQADAAAEAAADSRPEGGDKENLMGAENRIDDYDAAEGGSLLSGRRLLATKLPDDPEERSKSVAKTVAFLAEMAEAMSSGIGSMRKAVEEASSVASKERFKLRVEKTDEMKETVVEDEKKKNKLMSVLDSVEAQVQGGRVKIPDGQEKCVVGAPPNGSDLCKASMKSIDCDNEEQQRLQRRNTAIGLKSVAAPKVPPLQIGNIRSFDARREITPRGSTRGYCHLEDVIRAMRKTVSDCGAGPKKVSPAHRKERSSRHVGAAKVNSGRMGGRIGTDSTVRSGKPVSALKQASVASKLRIELPQQAGTGKKEEAPKMKRVVVNVGTKANPNGAPKEVRALMEQMESGLTRYGSCPVPDKAKAKAKSKIGITRSASVGLDSGKVAKKNNGHQDGGQLKHTTKRKEGDGVQSSNQQSSRKPGGEGVQPPNGTPRVCQAVSFNDHIKGPRVSLCAKRITAWSRTEGARSDFVVSEQTFTGGIVEFAVEVERLEGWAFVGVIGAGEPRRVSGGSLAESPWSFGWSNECELYAGGKYFFESAREMIKSGSRFHLILDTVRGRLSLQFPDPSRLVAGHDCHGRYLMCELNGLPKNTWHLVVEWLGSAKVRLVRVKKYC